MAQSQVTNKAINRLALPAMVSGLVEPLISLTDLAIVGSVPNDAELVVGAVGVSGSVLSALIWVFAQTKSSISAYVSKALGAKNLDSVGVVVPQILRIMLVVSMVVSLICFFSQGIIFQQFFDLDASTFGYAKSYFSIRILGFPLTLLTFSLFGLFRGLQNTTWAMTISIIGGATNILLDLILVKGWGVPAFGLEGAAYASVVSQLIMLLLAIYFVRKKVDVQFEWKKKWHLDIKPILKMTGNYALRTLALNVALILANKTAVQYGKDELAVHTVLFNLWLFSAFLLDGYANAANALSGKYLGAKDMLNLRVLRKKIVLFSLIVGCGVGLLFFLFKGQLAHLFLDSQASIQLFSTYVICIVIIQPFNAIAFAMDGVFKGMGEAKFLRNLLFFATGLGFVPALYLLDWQVHNVFAIWGAFLVWMVIRSIVPSLKFSKIEIL